VATNGVLQEVTVVAAQQGRIAKPRSERQPILSLVDREYLKSTANIPRAMWEPIAYLYSEADKSLERVAAMDIPGCHGSGYIEIKAEGIRVRCPMRCEAPEDGPDAPETPIVATRDDLPAKCLEPVKVSTIKNWHQVLAWLDEIMLDSQSVEALRSWQMMTGLQQSTYSPPRASGAVMPDFPQPQPPGMAKEGKRGLRN
jgi:hypothetical protein